MLNHIFMYCWAFIIWVWEEKWGNLGTLQHQFPGVFCMLSVYVARSRILHLVPKEVISMLMQITLTLQPLHILQMDTYLQKWQQTIMWQMSLQSARVQHTLPRIFVCDRINWPLWQGHLNQKSQNWGLDEGWEAVLVGPMFCLSAC